MSIHILFFGQLAEQCNTATLTLENIHNTDQLLKDLKTKYPVLNHGEYQIAVDKEIIHENFLLKGGETVALLPPYAGG